MNPTCEICEAAKSVLVGITGAILFVTAFWVVYEVARAMFRRVRQ